MSRVSLQMRKFALRLMLYETLGDEFQDAPQPSGFHVCEKLHLHLATFMGNTSFQTVLARALALSAEEVPWLRAVRIKPDRTLEGLEEVQAHLDPDELFDGGVVLLAQLLELLVSFIGAYLTVRLVREVWPTAPLNDLVFGLAERNENGIKNEKAKQARRSHVDRKIRGQTSQSHNS